MSFARSIFSPWLAFTTFCFTPSVVSHRCSFTVTIPSLSSLSPKMIAKGTSSFSLAANCAGNFGLFLAVKSVYRERLEYVRKSFGNAGKKMGSHLDTSVPQLLYKLHSL